MKTKNDTNKNNNIDIKTYINTNEKKYKINSPEKIESKGKKLELTKDEEGFNISCIKEKNCYTIITLHKNNPSSNENIINHSSLKVVIIKNLSNEKQMKMISKVIDKQSEIKKKDYISLSFMQYDFFVIEETVLFLFIFLLNDFYLYKIYENSEKKLYCEDIDFKYNNYDKYLFIGNTIDNNLLLEYTFLGKPGNIFIIFNFDLSQLTSEKKEFTYKIQEKILEKNEKVKVTLKQLRRGINIDKFLYVEKDSLIFVYKDKDKMDMLFCPFILNYKNEKNITKLTNSLLLKINEKMFVIIDLTKNIGLGHDKNKLILGIFEINYIKDENIFSTQLLQEISLNINSEDYNINYMSNNKIIIVFNNLNNTTIYYIALDNNCYVEKINQYEIEFKGKNYSIYEEGESIRLTIKFSSNKIIYFLINNQRIEIENYSDFIKDLIEEKLKDIKIYDSIDQNFNNNYISIKNGIDRQNIRLRNLQKKLDIITDIVPTIIKNDMSSLSKNKEDVKMVNNLKNNYLNNNINEYNNNFNNNIFNSRILVPGQLNYFNPMTPNNTINTINLIDPRNIIDQNINNRNTYNQFSNLNQIPINNIQNLNNINLSSLLNNNISINQQNNNSINPINLNYSINPRFNQ